MYRFIWLTILTLGFIGCEKKVDFKLKDASELLTVDASIENGQAPYVVLTKSLNYFSSITVDVLKQKLVKDAEVYISDGIKTCHLKQYDVFLAGNVPFSIYTTDPTDPARIIIGELGKTYQLKIQWQGKEYTSTTTIPLLRKTIDSIWWVKAPNTPDTSKKVIVRAKITDPPQFGDYARYFTRVDNGDFLPGLTSVFDDQLVNGSTYTVDVDQGVDRNKDINFEEYAFFKKGDKVTIKFSDIDKATFDFWRTVEYSYTSIGNPFSSPTKIIGNISNGALGYFGGYASQYKTLFIPQ